MDIMDIMIRLLHVVLCTKVNCQCKDSVCLMLKFYTVYLRVDMLVIYQIVRITTQGNRKFSRNAAFINSFKGFQSAAGVNVRLSTDGAFALMKAVNPQ